MYATGNVRIWLLLVLLVLLTGAAANYYINSQFKSLGGRDMVLSEYDAAEQEFARWKRIPDASTLSVSNVRVVGEAMDRLSVSFDYTYSGNMDKPVSACGNAGLRKQHVDWKCRPARIPPGTGTATVLLTFRGTRAHSACTPNIVISVYENGGSPFYSNYFAYDKKWLVESASMLERIEYLVTGC